jgi:hypothetical protein
MVKYMNKQLQQQNFDEQDITSGFIMNLIKLTQQNIRLGKQTINEKGNNVHRQIPNKFLWHKI